MIQFANPHSANLAHLVDHVDRRPVLLLPTPPVAIIGIEQNGVLDAELLSFGRDIAEGLLVLEFRSVNTNSHDSPRRKTIMPPIVGGKISPAIDASERPEVHNRDLALSIGKRDPLAVLEI